MNALVIGRFQPFHKGHLLLLKHVAKEYDTIIIGIGSSQYSKSFDNPFSEEERRQMIIDSLQQADIENYRIVAIPDIHNPPKWVDHVTTIVKDFIVVLSNNTLTKRLFTEKGYTVKGTPSFDRELYAGKEIRRRMCEGESWEHLVPEPVAKIIVKIKGVQRLRKFSDTN